jgi:hypothetical protein
MLLETRELKSFQKVQMECWFKLQNIWSIFGNYPRKSESTTQKTYTEEILFLLTYETEIMISVKIGYPSHRVDYILKGNENIS